MAMKCTYNTIMKHNYDDVIKHDTGVCVYFFTKRLIKVNWPGN